MSTLIVENNIAFVSKMEKSVETNVVVQAVGIINIVSETFLFKRKKILPVTVKKVNVLKNIVNVMLMESNVVKVATAKTVRTFDNNIYILILHD